MKELSIEEKAKAYDVAIEKAKDALNDGTISSNTIAYLQDIFPKLKESEDERIIKAIKSAVLQLTDIYLQEKYGLKQSDCIAWLEKQCQEKSIDMSIKEKAHQIAWETSKHYDPLLSKECWCEMAALDMAYWLEKQGEQKHEHEQTVRNLQDNPFRRMFEQKPSEWSEDEKIRKQIKAFIKSRGSQITQSKTDAWIDWLEKQGEQKSYFVTPEESLDMPSETYQKVIDELIFGDEQKPVDKIEPKFKVGEWVFIEEIKGYKQGAFQIKSVNELGYDFDEYHTIPLIYEELLSKWTIQDAKDGDVLTLNDKVFIYAHRKQLYPIAVAHCFVDSAGGFYFDGEFGYTEKGNLIHPATKEQRDLLFQKMKEAGYEWDVEKKELRKIEQKPDNYIVNWKKGDILSDGTIVLIVDSIGTFEGETIINSWYFADSKKFYGKGTEKCDRWCIEGFRLATEAECNYLFKMMNEAGFTWNKESNTLEDYKPTEWSEKDEEMLTRCIGILGKCYIGQLPNKVEEELKWLKSLKSKMQPKT